MKFLTIFIGFVAAIVGLVSPNFVEELGLDGPGFQGVLLIAALIGLITLIGEFLKNAEKFNELFSALSPNTNLLAFLIISSLVGGLSALVGASPYIIYDVDLGLTYTKYPDHFLTPKVWELTARAAWEVKFVRVLAFGVCIGFCLSLILTHSLLHCIFRKELGEYRAAYRVELLKSAVYIICVAGAYAYLGSHMSEAGQVIQKFLALFGQGIEHGVTFGSGRCEDLDKYFEYPKYPIEGNNNICDVGPIGLPYLLLSIAIFNSYWIVITRYFGRNSNSDQGIFSFIYDFLAKNLIATGMNIIVLIFVTYVIFKTNDAQVRQAIIDSKPGIIIFAIILGGLSANALRAECKSFVRKKPVI